MGQGSRCYACKVEAERLESHPMERDLGVWVDGKLSMSQQCALAAIGPTISWGTSGTASLAG